ncbi:S4 domain-containing protein [Sphingomonas sp. 28-62-20]|uniref:S4 domain-containing protein n=1 Tax=Sphingomonas sp. 28-62-20 TaxID=1970433 RepID=UPI0026A22236
MRLDRFLWYARLAPDRARAQALASAGTLRIDGRVVSRPAAAVRVGNVLGYVTHGGTVRILRVVALPLRRGPAEEAAQLYIELTNPG